MKRIGVVVFALASAGCSDEPTFDRRAMLESLAREVIVPSYEALEAATRDLSESASQYCDAPSESALELLRSRWSAAHGAMRQTDAFSFGPAIDEPLRLAPKLDFWPVREATIDQLLASDLELDASSIASQGAAVRGLPAIERTIFDAEIDARECSYVVAASEDAAATASMLRAAWADAYASELASSGAGGTRFESLHAAVSEVVSRSVFAVENAIAVRIGKPAGDMNGGVPDLGQLESPFSDRSLEDIEDSIRGVENVYLGRFGERRGVGIRDYVLARNRSLDEGVAAAFEQVYAAIDAVPGTLRTAIEGSPELVDDLQAKLRVLHRALGVDVAAALAVTVTFNDTDGD